MVSTDDPPAEWLPAYLDWDAEGQRVAKVRPPADMPDSASAWRRTVGSPTLIGRITR